MSGALRSLAALAFFSVVIGALFGSGCDLMIPYADLASLERLPEAQLRLPEATQLSERKEDHRLAIDGPVGASLRRWFGTAVSAERVYEFHGQALSARGWVSVPPYSYLSESRAWEWCYGDAGFRLGIAKASGPAHATMFETDLFSKSNATWRELGRPCATPFPPTLRESVATAGIVAAIVVFFVAAQLTRQRALAERGPSEQRVIGLAGASAYFLWVPYLVVWLRPAPAVPLPEALRWAGLLLAFAGVAIALWAMRTLGRHYDLELELHRGHELVRRGPYAVVRHPIYSGLALHFVGACLATGNVILILGTLLVSFPAFYLRARAEEKLLRGRFGVAYDAYAREVGMLAPRLKLRLDGLREETRADR